MNKFIMAQFKKEMTQKKSNQFLWSSGNLRILSNMYVYPFLIMEIIEQASSYI